MGNGDEKPAAKELKSGMFKQRIVRPKKGRGLTLVRRSIMAKA
jgi:hypothetical protein